MQKQQRGKKRAAAAQPSAEDSPQSAGIALLASVGAGRKADGWVLTCTAVPTSDVVIETHKEDDMY